MSQAIDAEDHEQAEQTGDRSLQPDPTAHVHKLRNRRHSSEKDLKCVITQRDSETGGGKTTLAVWLALCWDEHGWHGKEKGMTDPDAFLETFPGLPPHSVMILDEAEELDARRSMQDENIEFSKKWMKMRTRQIDSILTLPTTTALDKRILELADLRIHVTGRGRGKVYEVTVDDRSREVDEVFKEFYHWPDVSDSTAYQNLDMDKQEDLDGEGSGDAAEKTPKDVAQQILLEERLDEFIFTNSGDQRYLSKEAIGGEFGLQPWEAKQVKGLIQKSGALDDEL
jgi:hypothetical protein